MQSGRPLNRGTAPTITLITRERESVTCVMGNQNTRAVEQELSTALGKQTSGKGTVGTAVRTSAVKHNRAQTL